MKFFAFVLVIFSLVGFNWAYNRDAFRAELSEQIKKCRLETHASDADIENFYYYRLAATREGKCLDACLMRIFNVIDDWGRIRPDVFWSLTVDVSQGNYRELWEGGELINACKNLPVPADPCESSQVYIRCMKAEATKRGIEFVYVWGPESFLKLSPFAVNHHPFDKRYIASKIGMSI